MMAQKVTLSTKKSLSLGLFTCSLLIPPTQANSNYDIAFFSVLCSSRFVQQLVFNPLDSCVRLQETHLHIMTLYSNKCMRVCASKHTHTYLIVVHTHAQQ